MTTQNTTPSLKLPPLGEREYTEEEVLALADLTGDERLAIFVSDYWNDEHRGAIVDISMAVQTHNDKKAAVCYLMALIVFGTTTTQCIVDFVAAGISLKDYQFMVDAFNKHKDFLTHPECLDFIYDRLTSSK